MPTQDKHISHTQGAGQIGLLAYKLTKNQQLPKTSTHQPTNSSTQTLTNLQTNKVTNLSTYELKNSPTNKLINLRTYKLIN